MIGGLSAQLEAFNPQLFPADSQNELQDSLETPRHVRPCLLSDDDDGEEAPKKALNKLDRLVKRRQKTVIPVEIGSEDGIEENDCNSSDNEDDENGFKQDDFRSNSEDDVKNRKIKDTKKSTPPKSIKKPSKAQLESMLRESERLKRGNQYQCCYFLLLAVRNDHSACSDCTGTQKSGGILCILCRGEA